MASSTKLSGTRVVDSTIGTIVPLNPGRAAVDGGADGGVMTWAMGGSASVGQYLESTNYGFAIDAAATITGVKCVLNCYASGNVGDIVHSSCRLVQGGTIAGSDLATGNVATTDSFPEFGADGQLWGLTLTPDDVNASTFGFVWAPAQPGATTRTASVDYVEMTVYYTMPAAGGSAAPARPNPRRPHTGRWSGGR